MARQDDPPQWITCPTCGGSGYIAERRMVKRKDGWHEEWVSAECKQCDSSGLVKK